MRIIEIRSAGLRHGAPEGGWANEIPPAHCVHTLIAVFTDERITGWGSVSTWMPVEKHTGERFAPPGMSA